MRRLKRKGNTDGNDRETRSASGIGIGSASTLLAFKSDIFHPYRAREIETYSHKLLQLLALHPRGKLALLRCVEAAVCISEGFAAKNVNKRWKSSIACNGLKHTRPLCMMIKKENTMG